MNLAELIRLSNRLEDLTVQDLQQQTQARFDLIMHQAQVPDAGIDDFYLEKIATLNFNLNTTFDSLQQQLEQFKQDVKKLIENEGAKWLQISSAVYEQQLESKNAQQSYAPGLHRNKPLQLEENTARVFRTRVGMYSDWHYPAIIIHPMLESFIQGMASSDPLYLVDESPYLLEPAMQQWNEAYQNRLRPIYIEESFEQPILDKLPDNQFGLCLAYNYFNYRPYEIIKNYLTELYQKLKPGGVLIFTFNDCDRFQAIQMVEQRITCYTPGSLIKGWANFLGFETVFEHQDDSANVWIELKKPGQLTSLRGGQCLAKIIPKPIAKSK